MNLLFARLQKSVLPPQWGPLPRPQGVKVHNRLIQIRVVQERPLGVSWERVVPQQWYLSRVVVVGTEPDR